MDSCSESTEMSASQPIGDSGSRRTSPRTLVIGDVHGCLVELRDLIELAGLAAEDRVIALGDVVDRGPDSSGVLELLRRSPSACSLMGNHERKHVRSFRGEVPAALSQQIVRKEMGDEYPEAVRFMESFPPWVERSDALLVHGFWEPGVPLREQKLTVIIGTLTGEQHLAKHYSKPWYELYDGERPLIVGHHDYLHTGEPLIHQDRVFCLDTGCCFGGRLTGLLLPEWRIVSVPSRANYWLETRTRHARPRSAAVPIIWSEEDELILSELIRHSTQVAHEAYATLHATHPDFDGMPAHEQSRLFAKVVQGNPLAPVLFRIKGGHGDREAMRKFLGQPRRAAALLAERSLNAGAPTLADSQYDDVGPITVEKDRYRGVYVRWHLDKEGLFTAWNCPESEVPTAPARDDLVAFDFWAWVKETGYVVGAGSTEAEARSDLIQQIRKRRDYDWREQTKYLGDWLP